MVASLLKILHSGVQNTRLLSHKGQPDISMFTKTFLRAGRFTTQWVRLDFDTAPNLGNSCTLTIPRKGHLVSRLYLVTTMPDISTVQARAAAAGAVKPVFGWTNSLGHALLAEATLDIGGSRVERLDGRFLEVHDEFYTPLEKQIATNKLIKRKDNGFTYDSFGTYETATTVITPLPFWFSCGDSALALPIDAIQADSVVLSIQYNPIASLYVSSEQVPLPSGAAAVGDAYTPLFSSKFYDAQNVVIPNIVMPDTFSLGPSYILAEYIYLDKPEANKFRIADIRIPIVQHYPYDPIDSKNMNRINTQFRVPNPTRSLYFYLNRYEALRYNAPFLATRDLSDNASTPWWPDASGLNTQYFETLRSGYSTKFSEPIKQLQLVYEGNLVRYATDSPSLFRSLIPSLEMKKSPWVNKYYYLLPFCFRQGHTAPSTPYGEANLDKMHNIELQLDLHTNTGSIDPNNVPRYYLYLWAETYNILRVYGGRAGLLFAY